MLFLRDLAEPDDADAMSLQLGPPYIWCGAKLANKRTQVKQSSDIAQTRPSGGEFARPTFQAFAERP